MTQHGPRTMRILVEEDLLLGCEAKDLVFTLIARIGTAGGTRHVLKYAGSAIRALGMAGETKMCNMSIEAAARGLGRSRRDDLRLT